MQQNTILYRLGLSSVGGVVTGSLGLVVGLAWAVALDVGRLPLALALGALGLLGGAISVQLTPTGGVIVENRTTVNYAVIVTYMWIAVFGCLIAAATLVFRLLLL